MLPYIHLFISLSLSFSIFPFPPLSYSFFFHFRLSLLPSLLSLLISSQFAFPRILYQSKKNLNCWINGRMFSFMNCVVFRSLSTMHDMNRYKISITFAKSDSQAERDHYKKNYMRKERSRPRW